MHSAELVGYLFFLLKSITIVISVLLIIGFSVSLAMRNKKNQKNQLIIKNLNKKYEKYQKILQDECLSKSQRKAAKKSHKAAQKQASHASKSDNDNKNRLFVLNFKGDIHATRVGALSEIINAILLIAKPERDEVLLILENQGGSIYGHGLAAAQLERLRRANIHLTVAVDKVAASGGYLMASIANYIIASPFAIIGSIGVIVQLPNFYNLLKKKSIDFEQVTAGQYKRTLSVFAENTKDGRKKMQEDVDTVHDSFKQSVKTHRHAVDLSKVANGDCWLGEKAFALKLVDELKVSDDFIMEKRMSHDIYELSYTLKKSFFARLRSGTETLLFQWFRGTTHTKTSL